MAMAAAPTWTTTVPPSIVNFGSFGIEGKMRLRSHLWLKIGTLLSEEEGENTSTLSSPIFLTFLLFFHAMCLSHVDFFFPSPPLSQPTIPSAHMEFHSHKTPRWRRRRHRSREIAARKHSFQTDRISVSVVRLFHFLVSPPLCLIILGALFTLFSRH